MTDVLQEDRPPGLSRSRACSAALISALAVSCAPDAFVEVGAFGDNPGGLRMFIRDNGGPALVFLHGCNQTHDAARTAGLVRLADERGFTLVAPEQGAFNNGNACFNWFERADNARDQGEAASIRAMIDHVDTTPVFIAGLSAGAAMTSSLLSAYPERFSAGAVLAGGPAGCASSVADAAGCMAGTVDRDWPAVARAAAPDGEQRTEWPRVLVMQGTDDPVVNEANADAVVAQWRALHGLDGLDGSEPAVATLPTRDLGDAIVETWGDDVVKRVTIEGLEHAMPIDPTSGCGEAAPFQRDIDLCAAQLVVDFFRL